MYKDYDCLLIELPNHNMYNVEQTYLFGRKNKKEPNPFPNDCIVNYHIANKENDTITTSSDSKHIPSTAFNTNSWGWTPVVVIDSIIAAIGSYVEKYRAKNKKISLVVHDWGSVIGLSLYHTLRKEAYGHTKAKQKFEISRSVQPNHHTRHNHNIT